jgi:hypothetical protein
MCWVELFTNSVLWQHKAGFCIKWQKYGFSAKHFYTLQYLPRDNNYATSICVTCKCGSAKYSIEDDPLLSHGNMRNSVPAKPKHLNRSARNFSVNYVCDLTWCTKIGWNRLTGGTNCPFHTIGLLYLFLVGLYISDDSTELHAKWLKQHGSGQGYIF